MSASLLHGANNKSFFSLTGATKQTSSWLLRPVQHVRGVSISSAIHQGLYKDTDRRDRRRADPSRWDNRRDNRRDGRDQTSWTLPRSAQLSRSSDYSPPLRRDGPTRDRSSRSNTVAKNNYPLSIPHTTAASQFLYGYSTVYAAVSARKRNLYKLYMHARGEARDEATAVERGSLRRLAERAGATVVMEADTRLLDKMSDGRPHNGVVLEASPLPIRPISVLPPHSSQDRSAHTYKLDTLTLRIPTTRSAPLFLLLDDVLDPGNLGAIIRTAYFLGVDAILLTAHVAPHNSAVMLKASAGAAEVTPLFRVDNPSALLQACGRNGWVVGCATTPTADSETRQGKRNANTARVLDTSSEQQSNIRFHQNTASETLVDSASDFENRPQVLIIGGEGRGLRRFITKEAGYFIEVLSPRSGSELEVVGLDSLNVSVAAGVVIQDMVARMRTVSTTTNKDVDVKAKDDESSGEKMFQLTSGTQESAAG